MSVFDLMLDVEKIAAFLAYREEARSHDPYLPAMRDYLLSDHYVNDVERLRSGDYYFSFPVKKLIPKSYTDRKRVVYHFQKDEMSLLRMMAFVLHDYDGMFSPNLYSFRRGISAKDCLNKMKRDVRLSNLPAVKADVQAYGSSIDIDLLIPCIERAFVDDLEFVAFVRWLLQRRTFLFDGQLMQGDTSALPGIPIHNLFTNLYLSDADELFSSRSVFYARYSDDIVMFTEKDAEAHACLNDLLAHMERKHLSPHPNKTEVLAPGAQFDFLGMSFCNCEIDVAKSSLAKLKRRTRMRALYLERDERHLYPTREDKARRLVALTNRTIYGRPGTDDFSWSRWAFPVVTKTDGIHELDLYVQHCLRFLLSGKWSNARYRVSYKELKRVGYKSLVRAFYDEKEC